ncbi:MAG: translational GTPase TypA [Eubacteriaceae bacterium]|nr:translational GTPase TypA [Eubacteriaceae bacterium]
MQNREDIRNIAIIAHVDHGKTTLVDQMLKQCGIYRANEQIVERVMDSNDLERERGITILAKNTSVKYKDTKINIVDTPGHADFGGEVERILLMVDGVLLLVDAYEGVMPQTKFVLKKALGLNKKIVVVINKIDRPEIRVDEVINEIIDLFIDLNCTDEQIDFPIVYASAREGYATMDINKKSDNIFPLLEAILSSIPAPVGELDAPLQLLISNIDYNDYVGRIGIGRIERGKVEKNQRAVLCANDGSVKNVKVSQIYEFDGLKRTEVLQAYMGDIIALSGIEDINIGETVCDSDCPEPLDFIKIDEPTISMMFLVNNSPFAGKEGKFVTSRNLRERLYREVKTNVSMRVEDTDSMDMFKVSGRGELHLSILIETMRREGFEFSVSRPKVIFKTENGKLKEPMEHLIIDAPEEYIGVVMEKMGPRKGEMLDMYSNGQGGVRLEFSIPSRGLIGFRNEFLTDTKGNGVMNSIYDGYADYKGEISERTHGSIISYETGVTTAYGLNSAQDRGKLFIGAGVDVYEGMIVGENAKAEDLVFNTCKRKHATNMRASGSDEAIKLTPPVVLSLEQMLEFIAEDELVEVTPKNIRMRKKILNKEMRAKSQSRTSSSEY